MPRKNKRQKVKASPLPAVEMVGPTDAQRMNGDYASADIIHAETFTRASVHLNRGGTPVARWKRDGALTDSQIAAIDHCGRLWGILGAGPRLIAAYGERIPGQGNSEALNAAQIDARDDLYRIIDLFPGPLQSYFRVFENVCRFDMPAGVAGGELSKSSRTAAERAHQVVCFVADIIATEVRL
jgi:hypothetical protein